MKRLWFDNKTGEFNWALVAVIAFAAILIFSIFTANVNIPEGAVNVKQETVQHSQADQEKNIE